MPRFLLTFLIAAIAFGVPAAGQQKVTCATCPPSVLSAADEKKTEPLGPVQAGVKHCKAQMKGGFPVPDPKCTPGAINPALTLEVLRNPDFHTGCVRDCTTNTKQKNTIYGKYGITHPTNNVNANQTCELDHLVSLELGGADSLDNIWPQCGPAGVMLGGRFFKIKDMVENYLAAEVKAGDIPLDTAQTGIASDWTQFVPAAKTFCAVTPANHEICFPTF